MNPVLQEPLTEYSYTLFAPRLVRWTPEGGLPDIPALRTSQPPPGMDQATFDGFRKAMMQKLGRQQLIGLIVHLVVIPFLFIVIAPATIALLNQGTASVFETSVFDAFGIPDWVGLVICVTYVLYFHFLFIPWTYLHTLKNGVEEQARILQEQGTSIYHVHFHSQRRFCFFYVCMVTFTRKEYTEPELM